MRRDFRQDLNRLGACVPGLDFARGYATPEEAWRACDRPDWLGWAIGAAMSGEAGYQAILRRVLLLEPEIPIVNTELLSQQLSLVRSKIRMYANGQIPNPRIPYVRYGSWTEFLAPIQAGSMCGFDISPRLHGCRIGEALHCLVRYEADACDLIRSVFPDPPTVPD